MFNFVKKLFSSNPKPKKEEPFAKLDRINAYGAQIQVKIAQVQGKLAKLKLRNLQSPIMPDELKELQKEIDADQAEIEVMMAKLKEMVYS